MGKNLRERMMKQRGFEYLSVLYRIKTGPANGVCPWGDIFGVKADGFRGERGNFRPGQVNRQEDLSLLIG